jgi:hypothetical protein
MSQRTRVYKPPEAASAAREGEDSRARFRKWIDVPCRLGRNAIVMDLTSGLETGRDQILEHYTNVAPYVNQSKFLLASSVTPSPCRLFAKRYIP